MERIALAYSGGLETSVAIPWLAEKHHAEIVAVTLDLGQGGELEEVRDRALANGAVRAHVLDVREEFVRDYILPSLKADAMYEKRSPMATALARPLIAKRLVEIAVIEHATAIAHGSSGKGHDRSPIDVAASGLNPRIKIIAPVRDWGMTRAQQVDYAGAHDVRAPGADTPCRVRSNLWGRSIDCEVDLRAGPPEDLYALTKSPVECPDEPAYVKVAFARGLPAAINGVAMPLLELVGSLGIIAGAHGVGRLDVVENPAGAVQSRRVHEAPAAAVLHAAHQELQRLVTASDLGRVARTVSRQYADLVYNGLWFTPLRQALDALVDKVQERVTGTIRMELFKGDCRIVGRESPHALEARAPETAGSESTSRLRVVKG